MPRPRYAQTDAPSGMLLAGAGLLGAAASWSVSEAVHRQQRDAALAEREDARRERDAALKKLESVSEELDIAQIQQRYFYGEIVRQLNKEAREEWDRIVGIVDEGSREFAKMLANEKRKNANLTQVINDNIKRYQWYREEMIKDHKASLQQQKEHFEARLQQQKEHFESRPPPSRI